VPGDHAKAEDPDLVNLARRLGAGTAWHHESAERQAAKEGAPLHQLITSSVHRQRDRRP
jgi:hypothetical protein